MKHDKSSEITAIASPVSDAIILICDKCGKKLADNFEENPSRLLQRSIKSEIKYRFEKGKIRAVLTSCLDVCPKKEIAVGIAFTKFNSQESLFLTVRPDDIEQDAAALIKRVKPLL